MKNLTFISIVALLIFLPISNANASVEVVLLDEVVKRGWGKPEVKTFTFNGAEGKATLKVFNGKKHKKRKNVIAAKILLNDEKVVGPRKINWRVNYQEIEIDLLDGENTLSVFARGFPKSKLKIQVIQVVEPEVTAEIGIEGGIVEVDDTESPISGTTIEIPPESIPDTVETVQIEITSIEIPVPLPEEDYQAGNTVNIESNVETFNEDQPIRLSIPYKDANNDGAIDGTAIPESRVGVKYLNETTMSWEDVPIVDLNTELNLATIETTHFSTYLTFAEQYDPPLIITQTIPQGHTITIDGDPSDWVMAGITAYSVDSAGDRACTERPVDYDITGVYSAVDDNYVYVMIDTAGDNFPSDSTFRIFINYKAGEGTWQPYADLDIQIHENTLQGAYFSNNEFDWWDPNFEFTRGHVLEFRIPITELNGFEGYCNVITAELFNGGDWYQSCDQFWFASYLNFRLNHRRYEDDYKDSEYTIAASLWIENNPIIDDVIESMTLKGPLPGPNQDCEPPNCKEIEFSYDTTEHQFYYQLEKYIHGNWDSNNDAFRFGELTEGGFTWARTSDDNLSLSEGYYRLVVTTQHNSYERDKYISGAPNEVPFLPSDSVTSFFDEQGNFHCYWVSPNHLKTGWRYDISTMAVIKAYSGDDEIAYLLAEADTNTGKIKIPNNLLSLLALDGDRLELHFQNRSLLDGINRSISTQNLLNLGQPLTPEEWKPPFSENWANGIDTIKWFPTYFAWPTSISIDTNSIDMNTYETEPGGGAALFSSKYHLDGDFDIQVDYEILEWQDGSCARLDFIFGFQPFSEKRVLIGLKQEANSSDRLYYSEIGSLEGGFQSNYGPSTNDPLGKLRITRTGNLIETFYWQANGWTLLGHWEDGDPLIFNIGSQPVSMALNNDVMGSVCGEDAAARINVKFSNFILN